jgi:phosphoglycerate dehydrogenase-like enzyme
MGTGVVRSRESKRAQPRAAMDASHPACVIAVLESLQDRYVARIEAVDPRVRVVRVSDRTTWSQEAPDAEVIFGFRPLREGALHAERLRWVHAAGAGVENLSQDVAGTEILVTNSHIHGDVIAEHVFALILAHTRRLPEAFAYQRERRWGHRDLGGSLLAGRTMGILGLGTLGRAVAHRAAAFGLRVWGTRRHPQPVPAVERVLGPDGLDEVLRVADMLVVTLPLTPETRGLIGARELALLPRGAFVVNVGRGGLIDEAALTHAVRSGHVAGAGLDVFEEEPLPAESPLWTLPQVIVTPHVAGNFPGYMDRAVSLFCENLRRYLAGEPLPGVVDTARGY